VTYLSPHLFDKMYFLITAVSSPESMPHDKISTGTEDEEHLLSTSSRTPKILKLGANENNVKKKFTESSFDIENDEYAQLSPSENNDVMAVISMKDSRGRKKVTSNKKQKIKLGNSLISAGRDVVYASPIMRIPSTRLLESKRSLTRVESAKNVTSIARKESTLSRPGIENVDPQSDLGWSSNLKLENSTNSRRRTKKAQISPVTIHTKPTRNMRSLTSAVNYPTIPATAVSGFRIATEDTTIGLFKAHSEDLLPVARMRSRASVDSRKREDASKMISLHPNKVITATTSVAEHGPKEILPLEASQQSVNIGYRSQNHSNIARNFESVSSDHTPQGQNEGDNVSNGYHSSTEAPNEFQKITASWRTQNVLTSPSKIQIESLVIGISEPLDNIHHRSDDAAKHGMVNTQNKIEYDSSGTKGFRRPLDVSVLLSNFKTRGRSHEVRGEEVITALNDSRSKSDEDSSPKDTFHIYLASDKSDDGEPSSDEDGVIAM
jgi:hypothetical protein